ncbi:MAG: porphobilinogen synthase [Candidatus Sumerlaeaceae bacterium]|nr:porphobilinogen synthase [Candidatus Sumerlaeaceae bacterium]
MEKRFRRLRMTPVLRDMVQETRVHPNQLILPMFAVEGTKVREEIPSMPGVFHLSVDQIALEARALADLGLKAVLLFGLPAKKDEVGSGAYDEKGIVARAIAAIKQAAPALCVITDICLCGYTSHGHCGIVKDGHIANDPTVELLAKTAVAHARAGADMVAPSDMMDLRIGAIRRALDETGFPDLPIMSYSTKFASSFYGPFRDAAHSTPAFGDRRSHQLDPANAREAIAESLQDLAEGADIIMVKPALPYLDIVRRLREQTNAPIAAYQVSGEYAMIKAAAARGWLDEQRAIDESLTAIKRAGADLIITYFAGQALANCR